MTLKKLAISAVVLVCALAVVTLDAEGRGGRGGGGGGGGGRGGGRGGGFGGGGGRQGPGRMGGGPGTGGREGERKEDQERDRLEQRQARVQLARIEYAKRERQASFDEESIRRAEMALQRLMRSAE